MGEKTALHQNFISPNYSEMGLEATLTSYRDYDVKKLYVKMWAIQCGFLTLTPNQKTSAWSFIEFFLENGPFTLCFAIMLKKSWNE